MEKIVAGKNQKRIRSFVALLLFAPGCSLFFPGFDPPPQGSTAYPIETQSSSRENTAADRAARHAAMEQEKQRRAAENAAKEKAIFDELERLRVEIATTKKIVENAKPFSEKVIEASRTEKARSSQVEMVKLYAEAAQYLESALRQSPSLELFDALAALPPNEATDRAVLASCAHVRPLVPQDGVLDFTGTCLDAAKGDAKKLVWPNARQDVAAYLQEEKERALEAAVNAEKERQAQSKVERYVGAAVFASGRCRFGNCLKDGWTARVADGDVDVSCSFSNCFKDGWTARFPDGSQASTRCSFSDCAKDGWTTTFPDGSQATTRCSFSNCLKDGWSTDLPGGETITTRCSFSDCAANGWETNLPGGRTIRCRCNFSKCFQDGATCE